MNLFARVLGPSIVIGIAAFILAAGVAGKWKGKVILDTSKMPKAQNPQQQKAMENGFAGVKKMVIMLELKANKTYIADAQNMPGKAAPEHNEGTWKQEGNTLWLTSTKSPCRDCGR